MGYGCGGRAGAAPLMLGRIAGEDIVKEDVAPFVVQMGKGRRGPGNWRQYGGGERVNLASGGGWNTAAYESHEHAG